MNDIRERLVEMDETTHFDITTDVANDPKPPWSNFYGPSKCCCQSIIRHDTREPWKPANPIKEKSKIRSHLPSGSEFKLIYERVNNSPYLCSKIGLVNRRVIIIMRPVVLTAISSGEVSGRGSVD